MAEVSRQSSGDGVSRSSRGSFNDHHVHTHLLEEYRHHHEHSHEAVERDLKAMASVESLDYEENESNVYQQDVGETLEWKRREFVILQWLASQLIAIATASTAFFINFAVENVAYFKFLFTFRLLYSGNYLLAFLLYMGYNTFLVLFSAFLVVQYGPYAAGSGIPEVKAYLNGIDAPGILSLNTLLVKIFGSIGSVGGGLAVGKEGPLVHTGACIASLLGQGGSKKHGLTYRGFRYFKSDAARRDLVTVGASSGVAAAFRAPVGGVLFSLEEAASWFKNELLWQVFFATMVVALVLRMLMDFCANGRCGHAASGGFIIFDISTGQNSYSLVELIPVVLLGTMGGLLGALFNKVNVAICTWRRDVLAKKGKWFKVLEACLIAMLTSTCSFALPLLVDCKPCPDPATHPGVQCPRPEGQFGNFVSFNCKNPNEYNDLATIFFNTQDDAIRNLFSSHTTDEYRTSTLLLHLIPFFILAVLTYGICVPSGLFVPAILCGSSYGRLVGKFTQTYLGSAIDPGTYSLLGAASFLGGAMRMTVSMSVILLELTNDLTMLPLIMLVLLLSKTIADCFNAAIYDAHLVVKRLPLLERSPEYLMRALTAGEAMSVDVVTLKAVEKVSTIMKALRTTSHNAFPVIDEGETSRSTSFGSFLDSGDGELAGKDGGGSALGGHGHGGGLAGVILRFHLIVLLKSKKDFQASPHVRPDNDDKALERHTFTEFGKPGSGHSHKLSEVKLSNTELEMYIDLHPFVNVSPYCVSERMSLSKAYSLFRGLGLRHLLVVPRAQEVLGVLSRKDLLPEVVEERLDEIELE